MTKVVSLSGDPVATDKRVPDPEVLRVIEDALLRAKRGEVVGVAVALAMTNDTTMFDYRTGEAATGRLCKYALHHAISMLAFDYAQACKDQAEECPRAEQDDPA